MKHWLLNSTVYALLLLLGLAGCEWTATEDDDAWSDRWSWANFTGTYRSGSAVVISTNDSSVTNTGTLGQIEDEVVAVGNGVDKFFAGSLANKPIYPGSVTITDGTESFEDGDGDGIFTGSAGGTGAINYDTGSWNVTFQLQPIAGSQVVVTYIYYVDAPGGVSGGGSTSTGAKRINRLVVNQEGNLLTFVDNDGAVYKGKMGRVSTTGGSQDGSASGTVVGSFEVRGVDNGITIYGTFDGSYTGAGEDMTAGTLVSRFMHGTWKKNKETGTFDMTAGN